jgi:hypothetical protein
LRDRYGLTVEQYDEIITAQCEKCAICGDDLKQAFIDHDHKLEEFVGSYAETVI